MTERIKITIISGIISVILAIVGGYFTAQHLVDKNAYLLTGIIEITGDDAILAKLNSGIGTRNVVKQINFADEFNSPPAIIISITAFDINDGATINLLKTKIPGKQDPDVSFSGNRIQVFSRNITTKGFECEIKTWSKTEVYMITINWYAIPSKVKQN